MHLKRKLPWILTGKSLLAVASISMVALALVTYTATITVSFNTFFLQGANTMTWSAFTTSIGTRYFTDGTDTTGVTNPNTSIASPVTTNNQDFAFVTKGSGAGYVKISISTAASTNDFQSFRVFVLTFAASTWSNATIYQSDLTTVITGGLDGTSTATTGYMKVVGGSTVFYLIQVNYALVGSPLGTTTQVVYGFTPSLN